MFACGKRAVLIKQCLLVAHPRHGCLHAKVTQEDWIPAGMKYTWWRVSHVLFVATAELSWCSNPSHVG
jgi:hypothetical protein